MPATDPNLEAFNRCYFHLLRPCAYYAGQLIRDFSLDPAVAMDIADKSFTDLYLKGEDFNSPAIKAILYKAVRHDCLDYIRLELRRRKKHGKWLDDTLAQAGYDNDNIQKVERLQLIRQKVDALPYKQRIYIEDYLNGMSADDAAAKHHISKQTYQNHKSTGIGKLIRWLQNLSIWLLSCFPHFPWKK